MTEWTSPQLQRMASEAVWDQATYDKLIANWHHRPQWEPTEPKRAMTQHGGLGLFRVFGRPGE